MSIIVQGGFDQNRLFVVDEAEINYLYIFKENKTTSESRYISQGMSQINCNIMPIL